MPRATVRTVSRSDAEEPRSGRGPTLLRGRWLAGHLLALALVATFIYLGFWQLQRLEAKRERNAIVTQRGAQEPVGIAEALSGGDVPDFLPVRVSGSFDSSDEVLLRGRSLGGAPGFNVLTPLVLDESAGEFAGSAVLVERGWVPYDHDQVPVLEAQPPQGRVTVMGEVRSPQHPPDDAWAFMAARDPAAGRLVQTFYVDLQRLAPQVAHTLVPAYVVLRQQTPPSSGDLPRPLPEISIDEGPHLGYAIQWFGLALVSVVGYFFLMRSTLKQARSSGPGQGRTADSGTP